MTPKRTLAISALLLSPVAFCTPAAVLPSRSSAAYPDFIHPSNGDCKDYIVNSTITYSQLQWSEPLYKDNYEVASLLSKIAALGKVPFNPFNGAEDVTKTFSIAGTFCKPKLLKEGKETKVLVATHGAGFDRRYWASSFSPSEYNFAQSVLDAGFSIFYYDRLGVGLSSQISGYEVEINPQIELLASLLQYLRKGTYTLGVQPTKLVLVGHSFGSSISNFLLGRHPDLAEAAVFTGFAFPSPNDSAASIGALGLSVFASSIVDTLPADATPEFAEKFNKGWLSFADKYAYTEAFLGAEDYEIPAAEYSYKITQPYSGVEFSSAFVQTSVADNFTGKVLFAPGGKDLFFCAGNCTGTYARGLQETVFPKLKGSDFSYYFQEDSGHGQNFALNAKDMYTAVAKFVDGL